MVDDVVVAAAKDEDETTLEICGDKTGGKGERMVQISSVVSFTRSSTVTCNLLMVDRDDKVRVTLVT